MGFRFRKKIKVAPGIAINLNKSAFTGKGGDGASISIGGKGLGANINKRGVEGYASATGTGLGYRTKRHGFSDSNNKPATSATSGHETNIPNIEFGEVFNTPKIVHLQRTTNAPVSA